MAHAQEGKTITVLPQQQAIERTRVHVDSIALGLTRQGPALKVNGVRMLMPKSHLAKRLQTNKKARTTNSKVSSPRKASTAGHVLAVFYACIRLAWSILASTFAAFAPEKLKIKMQEAQERYQTSIAPLLREYGEWLAALLLNFIRFNLQLTDLDIEVQSVLKLKGSAFTGFTLVHRQNRSRCYLALAQIQLMDLAYSDSNPIFEVADTAVVKLTASVWPKEGCRSVRTLAKSFKPSAVEASFRVAPNPTQTTKGRRAIYLDTLALADFANNLKAELIRAASSQSPVPLSPMPSGSTPLPPSEGAKAGPPPIVEAFKKITVDLPALTLAYGKRFQDTRVEATLQNLMVTAETYKDSEGVAGAAQYAFWMGKQGKLAFGGAVGWKSWEINLKTMQQEGESTLVGLD